MELLITKLNKIISYQFLLLLLEGANNEQSSQNNKSTRYSSNKYGWIFFQKKSFSWGTLFWAKNLWGGHSKW